ncbi:MAG: zinc-ribbon domain-containing protein [Ruminococcaceae bacterium]|nr:zinc-ribbon domain-containing protein [Oscillospiraceae bacterium]
MVYKFCPDCGTRLEEGFKFCPGCGAVSVLYDGEPEKEKLLRKVNALIIRGKYSEAKSLVETILDNDPEEIRGYVALVRIASNDYFEVDDDGVNKAVAIVERIAKLNSSCALDPDYTAYIQRREAHFMAKKQQEEARRIAEAEYRRKEEEKRRQEEAIRAEEARIAEEKRKEYLRHQEEVRRTGFDIIDHKLIRYAGPGGDVVIPSTVTEIGRDAFKDFSSVTGITVPHGVTTIGCGAFANCKNLVTISLPSSIQVIEGSKVIDVVWDVDWPSEIRGKSAFYGCAALRSIQIPYGVTVIEERMFNGCVNLTSVTIPNSVKTIGHGAFEGCVNLRSITIPDSVTKIDRYAFADCKSLTSISLPSSIDTIGYRVFSNCEGLTSITVPCGVKLIEDGAFRGCKNLATARIPVDTQIHPSAFPAVSGSYSRGGWYTVHEKRTDIERY